MPTYQPRLKTVARLREANRNMLRLRLAEAQQASEILHGQRRETNDLIAELLIERRRSLHEPDCDLSVLLASQRYEAAIRSKQITIDDNLVAIEKEIVRRQEAAAIAHREVRVIELLNERALQRHNQEAQRRENRMLDEFGSQQKQRQNKSADESLVCFE